jgi:hypothetical protein
MVIRVRMAKEMVAVVEGNSEALKKKEEVHRFAMLDRCITINEQCYKLLMGYPCRGNTPRH